MKNILILTTLLLIAVSANAYERTVTKNGFIGCSSREYFEKLMNVLAKKDTQAFQKGLTAGMLSGDCAVFKLGQKVDVTDQALLSGLFKIRPDGDMKEYWTLTDTVR